MSTILSNNEFDVIVDFMVYRTDEFRQRAGILLKNTKQYIFLSSSRVYADTTDKIRNDSMRLLDICTDEEYLQTDEYALTKARQENILMESGSKNWTVIRPYITYNYNRLQLGVYEKEHWLYRALRNKPVVFSRDIGESVTTMTFGGDVAFGISKVIGNDSAMGKRLHITCGEALKWKHIGEIYSRALSKYLGKSPEIIWLDDFSNLSEVMHNQYQWKYDRLYKRCFSMEEQNLICGNIEFCNISQGIEKCIAEFMDNGSEFNSINWSLEGYFDKLSGVSENISDIAGIKNKIKYLTFRWLPLGFASKIMVAYLKIKG